MAPVANQLAGWWISLIVDDHSGERHGRRRTTSQQGDDKIRG
jgi:hypothetical protein